MVCCAGPSFSARERLEVVARRVVKRETGGTPELRVVVARCCLNGRGRSRVSTDVGTRSEVEVVQPSLNSQRSTGHAPVTARFGFRRCSRLRVRKSRAVATVLRPPRSDPSASDPPRLPAGVGESAVRALVRGPSSTRRRPPRSSTASCTTRRSCSTNTGYRHHSCCDTR